VLRRFVSKLLRPHVRYAGDVDGLRPAPSAVSHLTEYVVRLALRERWELGDYRTNGDRVRRLMFAERSELVEMASVSGLVFVGEEFDDLEMVLSTSDIGFSRPITESRSSQVALSVPPTETSHQSFVKSPSRGIRAGCLRWGYCVSCFTEHLIWLSVINLLVLRYQESYTIHSLLEVNHSNTS